MPLRRRIFQRYVIVQSFFTKRRATASRWHPTGSRGLVCDFGRKLEKLSMPVNTQCCAAKDGSTSLNVPRMARLRRTRPSAATPHQAYLAFLIFAQRNQTCQRHPENCALHCPLIPKYQFAKLYQITLTNISISHIL